MTELCKWDKDDYRKKLAKLLKLVENPQYVCVKCGRAAAKEKVLCKPHPLQAKTEA
jgi:hypothetical protein